MSAFVIIPTISKYGTWRLHLGSIALPTGFTRRGNHFWVEYCERTTYKFRPTGSLLGIHLAFKPMSAAKLWQTGPSYSISSLSNKTDSPDIDLLNLNPTSAERRMTSTEFPAYRHQIRLGSCRSLTASSSKWHEPIGPRCPRKHGRRRQQAHPCAGTPTSDILALILGYKSYWPHLSAPGNAGLHPSSGSHTVSSRLL